jgi:hypothetical protein
MPKTKLDKFLFVATVILLIAASYYILYPALKKIHYNRTHVLSQEEKEVHFKKIAARGFFVGKDGKRPFMIVDEDNKFHDGKRWEGF